MTRRAVNPAVAIVAGIFDRALPQDTPGAGGGSDFFSVRGEARSFCNRG